MISLKKLKIELMVNGVNIEKDALDYLKKRFGKNFIMMTMSQQLGLCCCWEIIFM